MTDNSSSINSTPQLPTLSGPSTAARSRTSGLPEAELLEQVLERAGIRQYDVLILGDGSGSGWQTPSGWAATLIDRETHGRKLFFGAMNAGSINLAELMPYFQALVWFHAQHGKARLERRGTLQVHIITDSNVIATQGRAAANLIEPLPKVQQPIWAGMREFVRLGYQLNFHWAQRCDSSLNRVADLLAGLSRRQLIDSSFVPLADEEKLSRRAAAALDNVRFVDPQTGEPISVYHINPHQERP